MFYIMLRFVYRKLKKIIKHIPNIIHIFLSAQLKNYEKKAAKQSKHLSVM